MDALALVLAPRLLSANCLGNPAVVALHLGRRQPYVYQSHRPSNYQQMNVFKLS